MGSEMCIRDRSLIVFAINLSSVATIIGIFRLAFFAQLYAWIIKGIPLIFSKGLFGNLDDPNRAGIIIIVSEKFNLRTPWNNKIDTSYFQKINN